MQLINFPEILLVTSKVSDGNMSIYCGDFDQTTKNKKRFFQKLKIHLESVVELKQVHGNKIIKLDKVTSEIKNADGLVTNKQNIYLMIKAGDCHQIGFYDPKNHAIALIHAGSKGLQKGIIKKVIINLNKNYDSNPKNLIVQFGPSIGPCCYKTDIWQEAENQLISCGVLKENINNPRICTYHNKEYFSHHQAENENLPNDYRFTTVLGLK